MFERQLNGVRPTIAGRRVFERTRVAIADVDHAIKNAAAAGRGSQGMIRVLTARDNPSSDSRLIPPLEQRNETRGQRYPRDDRRLSHLGDNKTPITPPVRANLAQGYVKSSAGVIRCSRNRRRSSKPDEFRLEFGDPRGERRCHRAHFVERVALGDVLWTVPIESLGLDQKAAFDASAVIRHFEPGQGRLVIETDDLRPPEELRPRLFRIIHEEERHAVVVHEIPEADILPVAAEIREADRGLAEHAHEPRRPAAVLDIGPAGLAEALIAPNARWRSISCERW